MNTLEKIKISGGVLRENHEFLTNGEPNIRSTKIFDAATSQQLNNDGDNLVLLVPLSDVEKVIKQKNDTIRSLKNRLAQCRRRARERRGPITKALGTIHRIVSGE